MAADLLDMAYINSLPQPFMGRMLGGRWWPIYDIEVQTGLVRIDVCGKLDVKHIGDFTVFRDDTGVERSAEAFYTDANEDERAALGVAVGATRGKLAPLLNAFGELHWKSGRGQNVPHEQIEAAFDAVIDAADGVTEAVSPALERQRRLVATLPQTREDAELLMSGHREPWRVDLPDGAYTQLPGDPPGPAALRRVQGGIVYDVQPCTGRLLLAAKPRAIPGGAATAIRADGVEGRKP